METFDDPTRGITGDGMTTTDKGLYYDPYDFEIDKNPHPIWKRLRDERPLYYNKKYEFYALSRFDDVEGCFKDWRRYSSARGTLLELVPVLAGACKPGGDL